MDTSTSALHDVVPSFNLLIRQLYGDSFIAHYRLHELRYLVALQNVWI